MPTEHVEPRQKSINMHLVIRALNISVFFQAGVLKLVFKFFAVVDIVGVWAPCSAHPYISDQTSTQAQAEAQAMAN